MERKPKVREILHQLQVQQMMTYLDSLHASPTRSEKDQVERLICSFLFIFCHPVTFWVFPDLCPLPNIPSICSQSTILSLQRSSARLNVDQWSLNGCNAFLGKQGLANQFLCPRSLFLIESSLRSVRYVAIPQGETVPFWRQGRHIRLRKAVEQNSGSSGRYTRPLLEVTLAINSYWDGVDSGIAACKQCRELQERSLQESLLRLE